MKFYAWSKTIVLALQNVCEIHYIIRLSFWTFKEHRSDWKDIFCGIKQSNKGYLEIKIIVVLVVTLFLNICTKKTFFDIWIYQANLWGICAWHIIWNPTGMLPGILKHYLTMFVPILLLLLSVKSVCGLPTYCYNYYSEFSLDEHYNPTIYPEVNTTITDITTLYKVSEVLHSIIYTYNFIWQ